MVQQNLNSMLFELLNACIGICIVLPVILFVVYYILGKENSPIVRLYPDGFPRPSGMMEDEHDNDNILA